MNRMLLLALCALPMAAVAQFQLEEDVRVRVDLPDVADGSAVYQPAAFFVDVPAGARSFRVELEDLGAGRNIDLYMRADQLLPGADMVGSIADIEAAADFFSRSDNGDDLMTVQDSVFVLPGGRRWFIGVVIFGGSGGAVAVTYTSSTDEPQKSTINVVYDNPGNDPDCDVDPWVDSTPFTPIGNNPATTLGQARRNSIERAASLLADRLFSPVPITVSACWEDQGGDASQATLGQGSANRHTIRLPGATSDELLYASAISERRAGAPLCNLVQLDCSEPDVTVRFNTAVDGPVALGSARFYYGYSGAAKPAGDADFLSTAMHEIIHGLGYISLLQENGQFLEANDGSRNADSYTNLLIDNRSGAQALVGLNANQRGQAISGETNLQWGGAATSLSQRNQFRSTGLGLARMHAPQSFTQGGSLSHLGSDYCELMIAENRSDCPEAPFRSPGMATSMLDEIGWSSGPRVAPYNGLLFDRRRNGHGVDLRLAGFLTTTGEPIYVMTFYTYESGSGAPEWLQAVGTIRNGVFASMQYQSEPFPEGFARFTYAPADANANGAAVGNVMVSFNDPATARACNDGVDRSNAPFLVPMSWVIDGQAGDWCMEPVVAPGGFPTQDIGGLWYAGNDDLGWGFTIENFTAGGSTSLFVVAYVFADDNTPVWYYGLADGFQVGQPFTVDLVQRDGYGRLGVFNNNLNDRVAGTLTLNLVSPSTDIGAGNTASLNVDYLGAEGGTWSRPANTPIALLLPAR